MFNIDLLQITTFSNGRISGHNWHRYRKPLLHMLVLVEYSNCVAHPARLCVRSFACALGCVWASLGFPLGVDSDLSLVIVVFIYAHTLFDIASRTVYKPFDCNLMGLLVVQLLHFTPQANAGECHLRANCRQYIWLHWM